MTKFMLYEVGKNALKCDNVIHIWMALRSYTNIKKLVF